MAILGVSVIASLLFYVFYKPAPPIANLSPDQEKGYALMELLQMKCLASENQGASLGFDALLNAKSANVKAEARKETIRGAVGYVSEQIRQVQDREIRSCLDDGWTTIEYCLLDNCAGAQVSDIEVRFSLDLQERDGTAVSSNIVALGRRYRDGQQLLQKIPPNRYFPYNMGLPPVGQKLEASIHRVVTDGFLAPEEDKAVNMCFVRATDLPLNLPLNTRFDCDEVKGICAHNTDSPKWLEFCPSVDARQTTWFSGFLENLTSPAYAGPGEAWYVPSLKTIRTLAGDLDQGYTVFKIQSKQPFVRAADGYFVSLHVNGQAIHIDGLAPDYSIVPFESGDLLSYEFALQNLNFSGVHGGCEDIHASIQFVQDGRLSGEPIVFTRSYIALRGAQPKSMTFDNNELVWSGSYVRADQQYDNQVFFTGVSLGGDPLVINRDADLRATMIRNLDDWKSRFDALELSFEGERLVAVNRPPLTDGYGSVVGVVQPTGQIKFTFALSKARRLSSFLQEIRSERGRPAHVIDSREFIYPIRGHGTPPPVCADDVAA
jgi:hypothetical protein